MYNKRHVLLLKLSYMLLCPLDHPQEEIYHKLKTIVISYDYSS